MKKQAVYTTDMYEACKTCKAPVCITKINLFRSLSDAQQQTLLDQVVRTSLKKGEVLIHEQDLLSSLVIISQGKLKAYTLSESGKQNLLYLLKTGDFFGQNSLFSQVISSYNVEAMEESGVCRIDAHVLKALIQQNPSLALNIIQELSQRLHQLENSVTSLQTLSVEEKILQLLESFRQDYGRKTKQGMEINCPMTQEEMGHRLGISRESVSRKLNELQDRGKLQLLSHKRILIIT